MTNVLKIRARHRRATVIDSFRGVATDPVTGDTVSTRRDPLTGERVHEAREFHAFGIGRTEYPPSPATCATGEFVVAAYPYGMIPPHQS